MKKVFIVALFMAVFSACKKDAEKITKDDKEGLQMISEGYAKGAATRIEVWTRSELTTGYNQLYLSLYDSLTNLPITNAELQLTPLMVMSMNGMPMIHAAPAIQPESTQADLTLFPCAAIFTMPGTIQNIWSLNLTVKKNGQNRLGTAKLAIAVKSSVPNLVKSITTMEGVKLVLCYTFPQKPKIGVNDFEMTIHRQQDMMTFLPENGYIISMTPEMPAMGHGSPNNINPVIFKNGLYKGKVNFTMTGDWKINLVLSKDNQNTTTFFDLTL